MTTTVTVKTHNREAYVKQVRPARFDGETETPAIDGVTVTVPADSEATYYVHDALDIVVSETPPLAVSHFHGIHGAE
jgi:hypothetical protein